MRTPSPPPVVQNGHRPSTDDIRPFLAEARDRLEPADRPAGSRLAPALAEARDRLSPLIAEAGERALPAIREIERRGRTARAEAVERAVPAVARLAESVALTAAELAPRLEAAARELREQRQLAAARARPARRQLERIAAGAGREVGRRRGSLGPSRRRLSTRRLAARAARIRSIDEVRALVALARDDRPSALAASVAAAAWAGGVTAAFRLPRERFWDVTTASAVLLAGAAVMACSGLRGTRLEAWHVPAGLASAAILYGTFRIADPIARRVLPPVADQIDELHAIGRLGSSPEIVARVALIGPAEEVFWRGFVQEGFSRAFGRWPGAALTAAAYTAAHVGSGSPALVGAAAAASVHWSGLYAAGAPLGALAVSHAAFDAALFFVHPASRHGREEGAAAVI